MGNLNSILNAGLFGATLGSFINALGAQDVVAVFDITGTTQLFPHARPIHAVVKPTSRTMEHPIENGQTIADHRIIMPVEIDLSLVIPADYYQTSFLDILDSFSYANLLIVQTKFGTYRNMIIADLPHEEDPDMFDAIKISLRLREVLFVDNNPTSFAPPSASPADGTTSSNTASMQDTSNSGVISPATPSITVTDLPPLPQ